MAFATRFAFPLVVAAVVVAEGAADFGQNMSSADPCLGGGLDCGMSFMQRRSVLVDARLGSNGNDASRDRSQTQVQVPRSSVADKVSRVKGAFVVQDGDVPASCATTDQGSGLALLQITSRMTKRVVEESAPSSPPASDFESLDEQWDGVDSISLVQNKAVLFELGRLDGATRIAAEAGVSIDPCLDGTVDCGASFMQRRSVFVNARLGSGNNVVAQEDSLASSQQQPTGLRGTVAKPSSAIRVKGLTVDEF